MIPARYQRLRDRVLAAVDGVFAEPVRISPMKNGTTDPNRQPVVIEAPLRANGAKEGSPSGGQNDRSWRTRIAAQRAELHIDRKAYPTLVIAAGDKVRALSRPGEPVFEVAHVDTRGATRNIAYLRETSS